MKRENAHQFVVFALEDGEFGFPVQEVREIVRPGQFTRVPLTPPYILGLTNLRGYILPVVDLRRRLGLLPRGVDDRSRLLVINNEAGNVGFLVDEVREVRFFEEENLEPPPETGETFEGFVKEVAKADGGERMVLILDTEKLVGRRAEELIKRSTGLMATGEPERREERSLREKRFLSFRLGQEEYAFPIEAVREIIRFRLMKDLPEAPPYVRGIITLRNHVLPIFDLRTLLGLPPLEEEARRKVQHLIRFFENLLDEVKNSSLPPLQDPFRCLLGAWLKERLENSRNEKEYALLTTLERAHLLFHQKLDEGERGEELDLLAEEILELLESLEELVARSYTEEQRILILEEKGRVFGLTVDRVEEVVNVPEEKIDPAPTDEPDLQAIAKIDGGRRLIFIFKIEGLLPLEDLEEYAAEGGAEMVSSPKIEENAELQLVTFNLGNEEYGIPIVQIQEINRLGRITRVPNTPEFVEGVTNLRGEVIPVIDLRKRFGIEARERDDRTRLVIVQISGKKTAFIVDWVNEVARLSKSDIEPPPPMLKTEVDLRFISGIAKVGEERMILILDVEEILSPEEKAELERMTASTEGGPSVSPELDFRVAE